MRIIPQQMTLQAIDAKLESQKQQPSYHIPASNAAEECDRALWLNFRWAVDEHFDGRMLRLFDRGKREESSVIRYLRSVKVDVAETGSHQREIHIGPWLKGFCDGIIKSGLMESPNHNHVLEIKTSNAKSFKELQSKGLKAAKPKHYTQIQLYLLATGINRGFYWCSCKDNDEIYTERVHLDEQHARLMADRANRIATRHRAPAQRSDASAFNFKCKFCKNYDICFNGAEPNKNCRTCECCVFGEDGKVYCIREKDKVELGPKAQQKGCPKYQIHQDLQAKKWWWKR